MTSANPKVDAFIARADKWPEEFAALRSILLACGLTEELKWGKPCYTHDGSNIAILQGFKDNIALMFFKGALMKDPKGILEKPGENSQAARRVMFQGTTAIGKLKSTLKSYVRDAIALEEAGAAVQFKRQEEFELPAELTAGFKQTPGLKRAFETLTPGRQRGYLLHIGSAKQSQTRAARVEKCTPAILAGKGLHDR